MHKYFNVVLVLATFALSVASTVTVSKDAQALSKLDKLTGINLDDHVGMLHKISMAMAVTSGVLLLMAVYALKFNNKLFGMLKLLLCVATFVFAAMSIFYGAKLVNDTKIKSDRKYPELGLSAGVVGILAVGSCSLTAFKMLIK